MTTHSEPTAAIKTLQALGYTYCGGELWKPPIGQAPNFDLIDSLRARNSKLEAELVVEAGRTAQQKLRADQMSHQHDTQAALNREAREQLACLQAQQAVPQGWKLVPEEPTDAMAVAAVKVSIRNPAINGVAQYKAMLEAAPTPPAQKRKPLTDEQIDALWGCENVSLPQLVNRRALSRSIERAHGIGSPAIQQCWCTTCRPITLQDMRFVVCPVCGNKRCPRAHNHELACTDSNAVGQPGSSWEHVKPISQEKQG